MVDLQSKCRLRVLLSEFALDDSLSISASFVRVSNLRITAFCFKTIPASMSAATKRFPRTRQYGLDLHDRFSDVTECSVPVMDVSIGKRSAVNDITSTYIS